MKKQFNLGHLFNNDNPATKQLIEAIKKDARLSFGIVKSQLANEIDIEGKSVEIRALGKNTQVRIESSINTGGQRQDERPDITEENIKSADIWVFAFTGNFPIVDTVVLTKDQVSTMFSADKFKGRRVMTQKRFNKLIGEIV